MLRTFGSPCPLGIARSRFLTTPSRRPPMPSPTLPKAGAGETNDEVAGPSRKTWYRSQGFGLAAKTGGSAVSNLPWESSLGKLGPGWPRALTTSVPFCLSKEEESQSSPHYSQRAPWLNFWTAPVLSKGMLVHGARLPRYSRRASWHCFSRFAPLFSKGALAKLSGPPRYSRRACWSVAQDYPAIIALVLGCPAVLEGRLGPTSTPLLSRSGWVGIKINKHCIGPAL